MSNSTHICLLRGINVGGHRKVSMKDLQELLLNDQFKQVRTYIQSGNIILESDQTINWLENRIANLIEQRFGFHVPVLVRSKSDWGLIVKNNPFGDVITDSLHLTFFNTEPTLDSLKGFNELEFEGEEFQVTKGCMYLSLLGRYSDAKLNNMFVEKKLGVSCTTRNWKTILKLNELIG
ncbi:MAG: DUF1697 domain-containing protein [Flavobacteriales bacterium]|nr:DUF1697 domain-containing protein [Flavobacteriales bacterium]MCB9196881.1 DUF1697 domain-containing protein [Flavobacteriales bacterium]